MSKPWAPASPVPTGCWRVALLGPCRIILGFREPIAKLEPVDGTIFQLLRYNLVRPHIAALGSPAAPPTLMTNATAVPIGRPRRFHFDLLLPALFRPRDTFARLAAQGRPAWLTPILILTITGLLAVLVAGPVKIANSQSGQIDVPPGFEFWTPEQQAQFYQAQQATSGPVFVYGLPALLVVLRVWFGWLVMGGVLHLVLTTLGGRDTTAGALNIVAWASLPFALRDLLQAGFILMEKKLLNSGVESFAPAGEGLVPAIVAELLARVTLYGLWYVLLLVIGVRATGGLTAGKAWAGVLISLVVLLLLGILPGVILRQVSGLAVTRPFLFF